MNDPIIQFNDLTKKYGSQTVVDKLNLSIRKGEIFGLLGPNGAGKSTTILMLMGLTEPDSGSVRVCGIDSTTNPIEVKKKVGYLPEDIGFYDDLTGRENLVYTARLNSIPYEEAKQKAEELLLRVGLTDAADKKAGKYSRGMRQRLGLADILIKNPSIIILDEPTLGIDPKGVRELIELIDKLSKEEGLTVLVSSHLLHQIQQICHRVGLFINGKLIALGDIDTLSKELFANSPYVVEARITRIPVAKIKNKDNQDSTKWLKNVLKDIDGIAAIHKKKDVFNIECSQDVTAEIAKAVIESGAALNYLNNKNYGLDEIYFRYFEGGKEHE